MKRILWLLSAALLLTACASGTGGVSSTDGSAATSAESSEPAPEPMELLIGKTSFTVDAYNPAADHEGVCVFDKDSGLTVSGTGEGYADILVFDSLVADIRIGQSSFMPFPNGYLIRMPEDRAAEIRIGDGVGVFGFRVNVSPKEHVLFKERVKIPIPYRNEARTAVAKAVLYDSAYIHDSTDTNIWGMEIAVSADGVVTEVVPTSREGVSGNTSIPSGGFVLSTGYETYKSMLSSVRVGDSARLVSEFGLYDFYFLDDLLDDYGEGEYLSKIEAGTTKVNENALEAVVSADGVVTELKEGGGTAVPAGGYVLVATGVKRNELLRFCEAGDRVFTQAKKVYILTDSEQSIAQLQGALEQMRQTAAKAKEQLLTLYADYASIDAMLSDASDALEKKDYRTVAELLAELEQSVTPYFAVEERGAWVADYDSNADDARKTVAYAASLGLNTLYVSPFRDTYALYDTKLPHLERHADVTDDLLQVYAEECRKAGISLIFMVGSFSTAKPSAAYSQEHYVNYFGDRLLLSKKGKDVAYFYNLPSYTLNPFDREVRQWYIDLIKEVCENYGVDGIQLDYIRFPLPTYYTEPMYEDFGYNEDIMAAFMKQEGTNVRPTEYGIEDKRWERWCAFRCGIITSFISELKDAIGDMPLSCTCFADAEDRRKYVFQDIAAWTDDIDAIYPMIYGVTLEDQQKYGDEMYSVVGDSCRIVLGIGTYDGQTDEVVSAQRLYAMGFADGNGIFALNYTQTFGFDKTYRRLFARNAVRTDQGGKTAKAYLDWMALCVEQVYEYVFACDLADVKAQLQTAAAQAETQSGTELLAIADGLQSLADDLPEGAKEDFTKKLAYLQKILTR